MAKIYRILGDNGIYIGSTTRTLTERFNEHKSHQNCESKNLINPKIELIEEVDENDRYIREQYWMDRTECVNQHRAVGLPLAEYQDKYRDRINENNRRWRANHQEAIRAKKAKPYECECGSIIRRNDKARHLRSVKHLDYLSQN
jgi:hypothetical protein